MLQLHPAPKIITFDCYGTLVQWHRAVQDVVRAVLAIHRREGSTDGQVTALADRLRQVAVATQERPPYRDYTSVLRSSLDEVFGGIGCGTGARDHEIMLAMLRRIAPHPEVPAALLRLRARYRLAIISNTDDDLITATVAGIGTPVDFVVTAQQARAYKPDHRLFLHAYASMGVTREQTVHVGMGQVTDMKVCHELGIRSVWIDRVGETPNPAWRPDAVLEDLSGLPDLLLPL